MHVAITGLSGAGRSGRVARRWTVLASAALGFACGGDASGPGPAAIARVDVRPDTLTIQTREMRTLVARAYASDGTERAGRAVAWGSSDLAVATVNASGGALGVAPGTAWIRAVVEGVRDSARVQVVAARVAWVLLTAFDRRMGTGRSRTFGAVVLDALGDTLVTVPVAWTSSDPAVASVSAEGLVQARAPGTALIRAAASGQADSVSLTVIESPVVTLVAPPDTLDLGDTVTFRFEARDGHGAPVAVAASRWTSSDSTVLRVDSVGHALAWRGGSALAIVAATYDGVVFADSAPVRSVARFEDVGTGASVACGLTTRGRVACWGRSAQGRLGAPLFTAPATDAPVLTALPSTVAGLGGMLQAHACALTPAGLAYCWGYNEYHQLDGVTSVPFSAGPLSVGSPAPFASVAAGGIHTCGLDATGAAWCWGAGYEGRVGNGQLTGDVGPTRVADSTRFTALAVGGRFSCGLAGDGDTHCWGSWFGSTPSLLAGGRRFARLAVGGDFAIGIDSAGQAWSWGVNASGQLGTTDSLAACPGEGYPCAWTPVLVAGGHAWTSAGAGDGVACGVTTGEEAYCWGAGLTTPSPVQGGLRFRTVDAGDPACGLAADGRVYCWAVAAGMTALLVPGQR